MAESKKYYWLKLKRDFFKRHDMRIIEQMPNGKACALFYVKLMLESIDHEGTLRFSEELPYDYEMLAAVTDTEIETVEIAMDYFIKFKLVKFDKDETIILPGVQQLIGSATDSDSAKRQKRYRERKKEEALQSVTENVTQRNASVTNNNESKRKRIDKDKDKELEKEREDINNSCEQVAKIYAALCPSLPPLEILSDSIKTDLIESIEKYGLDKFDLLFKKAEASSFLKGENERKWVASFDWLINADNIAKVLNGKFDNKAKCKRTEYAEFLEKLEKDNEATAEQKKTELSPDYIARVEALKNELQKG